jgi:uncharacterized protein involved in outer membrane biogenesis
MHLSLIPLAFRVDNVAIGEDPRFHSDRPFAQAQELDVAVKLWPLLHRDVQISSLDLMKPSIEMIRDQAGQWNFSTLGKPEATAAPQQPAPQPAPQQKPQQPAPQQPQQKPNNTPAFSLSDLKIRDGQIALTDYQKNEGRTVYNHIDLELKDFAPDKPFTITTTAHLPGAGSQTVSIDGTGGPIDQNNPVNTPFDGTIKLRDVSLSAAQKFMNKPVVDGLEGVGTGDLHVKNQQGTLASNGTLKLADARIRNVSIGYPITADYNIADNLSTDLLQIQKGDFKLGQTPLSVSGTVNMKPTTPDLDLKLNAPNVSIEEAARLAAAMGVAFNPGMVIKGHLNADMHAQGPANKPVMNGSLAANNLSISGKDVPTPVNVNAIDLALTPQSIRSNQFTASTGGTSLNAQFTLTNYTSPSPAIDMNMNTTNAQIGELLNIAKAYGVSAAEGMSGSGVLTLNVHATGPIKNTAAMNFAGSGAIRNASLKTPQLTQPLGVRNADIHFTQNSMVLQNLAASLGQTNATGNMTVRNLAAPQVQFTLAADTVNVTQLEQMLSSGPPQQQQPQNKRASAWDLIPRAEAAPAQPAAPPSIVTKMTGGGTITVGTVQYDQLVLNNLHSNVTLDHGIVKLAPLTAQLYGGQENGSVTIDMRPTPMTYAVNTKLSNVDANKLISSVSSVKQTLYGLLAANANAQFAAAPSDQIARTLNGTMSIDLRNGKLVGVDLLNQLASVGKFVGFNHAATNFTNLMQLTGNFNVQNGVASTNNLQAVIDGGKLAAVGDVNLASEAVNMHVTAVLSQAMSKMVGGTGIGGFMNTALANNRGELVIPVLVTGTLSHPTIAPDLQKVAQMKLQNMLPTANNPGQLTSGILGGLLGGRSGQAQQGQQQGGLGGILGAIGGQQQNQPNQQNRQQQPVAQPQQQQQQQQQPQNPLNQLLNSITGGGNQQQQQQQQQPHR